GILGVLLVPQDAPAHPPHQRPVPLHQRRERRLAPSDDKTPQQLRVGVVVRVANAAQLADVTQEQAGGLVSHGLQLREGWFLGSMAGTESGGPSFSGAAAGESHGPLDQGDFDVGVCVSRCRANLASYVRRASAAPPARSSRSRPVAGLWTCSSTNTARICRRVSAAGT